MDRSDDREPTRALDRLVAGMDTGREMLGRDLNWQLHNGLDYYVKHTRPDLVVFDLPDTLLSFPFLVSRNAALGRTVLLTDGSAAMVRQLYGGLYDLERDPRVPVPSLADRVATLAPGTPLRALRHRGVPGLAGRPGRPRGGRAAPRPGSG